MPGKALSKFLALFFIVSLLIIICTCIGPTINFEKSFMILFGRGSSSRERAIIFDVRFPRVLLAVVIGMALAASGAALQGLFRNPLASPYILGVSSGSAFGAALAIIIGLTSSLAIQAWAFTIGFLATLIAMFLSRGASKTSLLLAGVAMSSLFSALTSLSMYYAGEKLELIVSWILGSLATSDWTKFNCITPPVIFSSIILVFYGWRINVLTLGDEQAKAMGISPEIVRLIVALLSALSVASAVSVSGTIAFIGLITPHIARAIFGHDYRMLIPSSALLGGIILLCSDTLTRTLRAPVELPVGVLTSLMGAPFFLYLVWRGRLWEY